MQKPQGIGLGLRAQLVEDLLTDPPPALRWIEVAPENFMGRGGVFARHLARARERWPVVTHGLTLSLGGPDPLDDDYLASVKAFGREVATPWHSDHLCFGTVDGANLHDLLPVPRTREATRYVADRARATQDALDMPFAIENVSYYAHPGVAEFDEATMLRDVVEASGAKLLLDVNNVYVNARNHGFDPRAMIDALPLDAVVQMHIAGHFVEHDGLRVDTHGEAVCEDVYSLLGYALERTGPVPVLLERDQNMPPWRELLDEVARLDAIWQRAIDIHARGPR